VSQHLCRAANRLGDAGIIRAVAENELSQLKLFDNVLFSVEDRHRRHYDNLAPQTELQQVDADIKMLQKIDKPVPEKSVIAVQKESVVALYERSGFRFVRLSDITDVRKYRLQVRMACLQICGSIYVALDAVTKGIVDPIVVTIKE
jgi:hypothetical protein